MADEPVKVRSDAELLAWVVERDLVSIELTERQMMNYDLDCCEWPGMIRLERQGCVTELGLRRRFDAATGKWTLFYRLLPDGYAKAKGTVRPDGIYWVSAENRPEIARWRDGRWWFIGNDRGLTEAEAEIEMVLQGPLAPPPEVRRGALGWPK